MESFFANKNQKNYVIRASNLTQLAVLSFNDFYKCAKIYPRDYEKFCEIQDDILINNNSSRIKTMCLICNRYDHILQKCPFIRFNNDSLKRKVYDKILKKNEILKKRIFIDRKSSKRKLNSLKIKGKVDDAYCDKKIGLSPVTKQFQRFLS